MVYLTAKAFLLSTSQIFHFCILTLSCNEISLIRRWLQQFMLTHMNESFKFCFFSGGGGGGSSSSSSSSSNVFKLYMDNCS